MRQDKALALRKECMAPREAFCADLTHLVDHIGQQALNFVVVNLFLASEADGSGELGDWHAGAASRRLPVLRLVEATGEEDFPQEVAERNVAATLESEVDAPLHKLFLAFLESEIELVELPFLDAPAERRKEFLQPRIRLQQLLGREGVVLDEVAWDEVCEDKSGPCVSGLAIKSVRGCTHSLFLIAFLWQRFHASVKHSSACNLLASTCICWTSATYMNVVLLQEGKDPFVVLERYSLGLWEDREIRHISTPYA